MRRLHLRVFLSLLAAILASIAITTALAGFLMARQLFNPLAKRFRAEARLVASRLPPRRAPVDRLRSAIVQQAELLELRLALWSPEGKRLTASAAHPAPTPPDISAKASGWIFTRGRPTFATRLPDGRWLTMNPTSPPKLDLGWRPLGVFAVLAFCLALASFFVARRLTRRLAALSAGVEELGAGNLSARLEVRGKDEIAQLAERFNWAAARIKHLVESKKKMLASASHELRSPLARLRMFLELTAESDDLKQQERLADAIRDTEELDELVEDLLLASRLETPTRSKSFEGVDLAKIVSEEMTRLGICTPPRRPVELQGDRRMLQRLVRNLLENAQRHGGTSIDVEVEELDSGFIRLVTADSGPGVDEEEREKIFEPFYRPRGHREGQDGGVGLGLSLVRQIARHHGGAVVCKDRQGGGTEFVVTLGASPHLRDRAGC